MTLSINKPFSTSRYGKGIAISEVTIADVEDISGTIPAPLSHAVEIGLRLSLEIGKSFRPSLIIAGNFKRNEAGEVIGWGSGFIVAELLSKLGSTGTLNPDNSIPLEVMESLVGRKFLRLSYLTGTKSNGKFYYSDWNNIATVEEGAVSLARRFRASLAKGFPTSFHPELLDRNTQSTETEPVVAEEVAEDDVF